LPKDAPSDAMRTCEIVVSGYGDRPEDLCGAPATKSVMRRTRASGEPCKPGEGFVVWLCDEHYRHAASNWFACDF
jgi:hypothetical protein